MGLAVLCTNSIKREQRKSMKQQEHIGSEAWKCLCEIRNVQYFSLQMLLNASDAMFGQQSALQMEINSHRLQSQNL